MAPRPLDGATIAFDLDGTLVDTAPDLVGTLNVLLGQEGLSALPMEQARRFIGHGARRLLEEGFRAAGQALEADRTERLFERFLVHYQAHIADGSRPFPGCVEALDALRGEGASLAVCTNKLTGLSIGLLETLGLADRFAAVVGPDTAGCRKPDPRHLEAAVEAAGGSIGRAVLVGDASTDVGAARNAGAGLILVSFGYTEIPVAELDRDILIDRFDELPAACLRLLSACGDAPETL